MINKHLFVLLACVFVVMIGVGITMPVLPFYVERLAPAGGGSRQSVVMHVSLLCGVYVLGQLVLGDTAGLGRLRCGHDDR